MDRGMMANDSRSRLRGDMEEMMKKMEEMKRDLAALERGQQQDTRRPSTSMSSSASMRAPGIDDRRGTASRGDDMRARPRHSTSVRDRPTSSNASPAPLRSRPQVEPPRRPESTGINNGRGNPIRTYESSRTPTRSSKDSVMTSSRDDLSERASGHPQSRSRVASQSQPSRSRGDPTSREDPQARSQRMLAAPHPELKAEFTTQEQWNQFEQATKFSLIIFNKPGFETMELFVLRKYREYVSAHFHYTHICVARSPQGQLGLYANNKSGYPKDDPLVIWWREEAFRFLFDWNKFHQNGGRLLDLCEYYNIWANEEVRYPGRTTRPPIALRDRPAPPVLPVEDNRRPPQREPSAPTMKQNADSDRSRAASLPRATIPPKTSETVEQVKFVNATNSSMPSSSNANNRPRPDSVRVPTLVREGSGIPSRPYAPSPVPSQNNAGRLKRKPDERDIEEFVSEHSRKAAIPSSPERPGKKMKFRQQK
ncbi:hypothetical protein BDZ45DRAFT_774405 [Acephala macrosclerotiorum]|nr:hypothetical protein BDZ45DRAFT_774405 [Acephala macrosclerotiorum]